MKKVKKTTIQSNVNYKEIAGTICFWLSAILAVATIVLGLVAIINLNSYLNYETPTVDSEIVIIPEVGQDYFEQMSKHNAQLSTILSLVPFMFWLGLGSAVLMTASCILKFTKKTRQVR